MFRHLIKMAKHSFCARSAVFIADARAERTRSDYAPIKANIYLFYAGPACDIILKMTQCVVCFSL